MGWQPFIMQPLSNLVSSLAERGIETTIVKSFARQDLGLTEEPDPEAGRQYFRLFFRRFTKLPLLGTVAMALAWLEFQWRAYRTCRKLNPAVVVGIDVDTLPAAWWVSRRARIPLVYYSYELYTDPAWVPASPLWNAMEHHLIHRAGLVVACEPNRARVLRERHGLKNTPMTVLNVPRRQDAVIPDGRLRAYLGARGNGRVKVAYYHGWITEDRCAGHLVDAMRFLEEEVVLFLLGPIEPEYRARLLAQAQNCGLEHRVFIHPMVASEELLGFAAAADVGLQLQRNTGLNAYYCAPVKLFQYFAAGLPVVASDFPGLREIVEGGALGYCADPEDSQAIANAIQRVLSDPAARARMSAHARRAHQRQYCYEVAGADLVARIEKLAVDASGSESLG